MKQIPSAAFLQSLEASHFDDLCAALLEPDLARIPEIHPKDCHTDLFAYASEDDRTDALALFPESYRFVLNSFRLYLEEELDLRINDGLLRYDAGRKLDVIRGFMPWHRSECLLRFLTGKSDGPEQFNPLHVWEWCDGLAVMYVQNQQNLREELLRVVQDDVFRPAGMTVDRFVALQPLEQQRFCERHEELMAAAFQSLGSRFPREAADGEL
jgi:hypothetical protein